MTSRAPPPRHPSTVITAKPDRIAFEDRLSFAFDADGLLTVTIASVQHVLMPEEVNELRDWLFAQGPEFADDL